MKEFIKECLEDQESINGIRQLFFLMADQDGKRKVEIVIKGILLTCSQFPYIPEEAQKKIIREQMVKDQDYDALNSRTVYKWLNAHKDVYWTKAQEPTTQVKVLEPLSEETQKMIREWQAELLGFKQVPQEISIEIERIKEEDKARLDGKPIRKGVDLSQFQTDAIAAEKKALHVQYIRENYDPKTAKPLPTWKKESDWLAERS